MTVAPLKPNDPAGCIEVICGSMFSGKTEELIRRVREAEDNHQKIGVFKPSMDTRYHAEMIVSHDSNALNARPLDRAKKILEHVAEFEVIALDEAQFFDEELVQIIEELANAGKRLIIAGLDMDYQGKPFGPMPALLSIATYVTKLHAVCMQCGGEASFSFRKTSSQEQVVLGEKNEYEPRCRTCFNS